MTDDPNDDSTNGTDDAAPGAVNENSSAKDIEEAAVPTKQIAKEQRRVLFRTPGFIIGSAILLFWVVSAIFYTLITDTDPSDRSSRRRLGTDS